MTIQEYANNTPGIIPPFGELSTYSKTYTQEVGYYTNPAIDGYLVTTFSVVDTDSGHEIELHQNQANLIVELTRAVLTYAKTHSVPYDVANMRLEISQDFVGKAQNLELGTFVYGKNIEMPQFFTFSSPLDGAMDVRVWLSDSAFRDQHTQYDIKVSTALENPNDFFLPYEQVVIMLDEAGVSGLGDRIQTSKKHNPNTVIRLPEFYYHNKYDTRQKRKTPFGVITYGQEGDNIDAIKDAIVEHLLNNSDYKADDWEVIFPELFQRTEFIIVPRWDRLATYNLSDNSSLYSSMVPIVDMQVFLENFLDFLTPAFLRNNSYHTYFSFRTLGAAVVNGLKNAPEASDYSVLYKDFLPLPSHSTAFGFMSVKTQNYALFISEVLRAAETATPFTPLPSGMRRTTRNGKLFVTATHEKINYLVAARYNKEYK